MSNTMQRLKRAPARIVVSVLAIALAVTAMGVFGISDVASGSLATSTEQDRLGHILAPTSPIDDETVAAVAAIDGVEAVAPSVVKTIELGDDQRVTMVGVTDDRTVDLLTATEGRLPAGPGEVLASRGLAAAVGDRFEPTGLDAAFTVVGVGTTTAWAENDTLFVDADEAMAIVGAGGFNHLSIRTDDTDQAALDAVVTEVRAVLAADGATFRSFPQTLAGGAHPIEEDLSMISTMIGLLGIVAGIVALILLASTTNALVAEQTQEVAVMRALGGRRRPLRRRLRRLAVTIAAAGAIIGIPLGIVVSNYLARLILERFAGITPAIGVSIPVVAASLAFAVIGARLVAARAARRAVGLPLVDALRETEGRPFGRRLLDRIVARIGIGTPFNRLGLRSIVRNRARSVALTAQLAAAVGAAITVASLASSVVDFGRAELDGWNWASQARAVDSTYPFPFEDEQRAAGIETGIDTRGTVASWDVDVWGLTSDTTTIGTEVLSGTWLTGADDEAVVAESFARRNDIALGDTITVELASGPADYEVVGLHPVVTRGVFLNRDALAADLGFAGHANMLWTSDPNVDVDDGRFGPTTVTTLEQVFAEDTAARDLILVIFYAVGAIVITVAALSVASTMVVQLYERRHEVATLQAIGSTRQTLRRLVVTELGPLAAIGWALGAIVGWFGAYGIMEAFASANAIDLPTVLATWMIPVSGLVVAAMAVLIALAVIRTVTRQQPAVVLRAA